MKFTILNIKIKQDDTSQTGTNLFFFFSLFFLSVYRRNIFSKEAEKEYIFSVLAYAIYLSFREFVWDVSQ